MWVDARRSWIRTVVLGGFALPHIWPRTLAVTALATIATLVYQLVPSLRYSLGVTPFTIVGLTLGIFLGFRNNTAYDRFWEGRKLWGGLVNTTRSLTRQILTLVEARAGEEEKVERFQRALVYLVIAYVHAFRHHLRGSPPFKVIVHVLGEGEDKRYRSQDNVPYAMLERMGELLLEARRNKWLDPFYVPTLEASLIAMTEILGACERIKLTPIPFSYTVLMHRIVAAYCGLLPFGLVDSIKWATPVVVLAISYCFFGLDAIGDELEQPFGMDINDLPLKAISRTIERNLRERLGEELPPPVASSRGVLT